MTVEGVRAKNGSPFGYMQKIKLPDGTIVAPNVVPYDWSGDKTVSQRKGDWSTVEVVVSDFDGTMLFVSHDREFLRGLSNRVLELGGESGIELQPHAYPGSYIEYVERTGHEAPGVHA